ncbi:hypothetical protein QYF36_017224 [Acer negundo]|nr:hypothetical protein QYF36_012237 [Acer negundo]KAK4860092.1 hypothetical protein QYF36_017224 [Acer negundo]
MLYLVFGLNEMLSFQGREARWVGAVMVRGEALLVARWKGWSGLVFDDGDDLVEIDDCDEDFVMKMILGD